MEDKIVQRSVGFMFGVVLCTGYYILVMFQKERHVCDAVMLFSLPKSNAMLCYYVIFNA